MIQLALQLLGPSLHSNPVGNIANEAGEYPLGLGPDLTNCQLHRKDRARFVPRNHRAPNADNPLLSRREVACEIAIMLGMKWLGHEHVHVLTNHLGSLKSEHPLGRGTETPDAALLIDGHDCIRRCLNDRLQERSSEAGA
ncbi:MAG: hypothetical protein OEN23_13225 [Paracoccaceae bacterium]|nr:hypothetical protein [Paracoccaceae bacterium]